MTPDSILPLLLAYKYLILIPLAIVEGPVTCILVGLLSSLGLMNPFAAFGVMIFGDFIPDSTYYFIGRRIRAGTFLARFGNKLGITPDRLVALEGLWRNHTLKSIVFSKWAYGLSTPLLITAGMSHIPAKRFLSYAIPIIIFQDAVLITIGFYFGSYYNMLAAKIELAGYIVAGLVVCAIIAYLAFTRHMKQKFLTAQKLHPTP